LCFIFSPERQGHHQIEGRVCEQRDDLPTLEEATISFEIIDKISQHPILFLQFCPGLDGWSIVSHSD